VSASATTDYPAATAIGRRDGSPILQVYWLAARRAGLPLENPRQLSAYRYPRQYGPAAPSFSRAMLVEQRLLMISGTASIIGHASHHPGNLQAQIEETLRNLASVMQRAAATSAEIPARLHSGSLLKIYLRDPGSVDVAEAVLRERLPKGVPYMILAADICREDLLVEIDCIHGAETDFDIGTSSIVTPSPTGY
jgi:chorismate lyase/3-hydroxybenzoate synthase